MSLIPDSRADTLPCVAPVRTTECLTEDEVLLLRSRQGVNDARRHALIAHLDMFGLRTSHAQRDVFLRPTKM